MTRMVNEIEWIQCEECRKWRILPPGPSPDDLPDPWYIIESSYLYIFPLFYFLLIALFKSFLVIRIISFIKLTMKPDLVP